MEYLVIKIFSWLVQHPAILFGTFGIGLAALYVIRGKAHVLRQIRNRIYASTHMISEEGDGYIAVDPKPGYQQKKVEEAIEDFEQDGKIRLSHELPKVNKPKNKR